MDIKVLAAFITVANEENITHAAEQLHITQPALSRQLMRLEAELGVRLFIRGKHTIQLTEEGLLFKRRAQEMVRLAERTKLELAQTGTALSGEIVIGCNESQAMREVVSMISSFRQVHGAVQFQLQSGNNVEIKDQLEQGTIDLGVLVEPVDTSSYAYVRLIEKGQWGVLVHNEDSLAKRNVIHSEDITGVPMITIADEVIHHELAMWSGENAVKMVPVAHYNLLANAALLVQAKEGIAVCQRPACHYENLRFIPFEPKLELGSVIVWKDNQKVSRTVAAFLDHIKKCKNDMKLNET